MQGRERRGFALHCDPQGVVETVLHDGLELADRLEPDATLLRLVDGASVRKMLSFLAEVRQRGAAFNWEINVPFNGRLETLHFVGALLEDGLLVVGAETSNGVLDLYEEMMRITNDQANALRAAAKEQAGLAEEGAVRDGHLYDDLSRLNNELVALQRELTRKNAQLERLNEQKNQFLGMAAHDLRNPLGAIMAYSDFLLEDLGEALDEEQREFLDIIQASSEFMVQLIDDLLDVTKIETGNLELDLRPTDLVELVRHSVSLNRALASRKEIEVELARTDDLPPVPLDGDRMKQVLNNLLSNAIKYSYPESTVEVRVRRAEGRAVVSVADEGQGIPADELDRLFEPFGTTSVEGTYGERSTGLGLVIVKKIVERHGGEIWVESEVGTGSTFYVALPLASDAHEKGV